MLTEKFGWQPERAEEAVEQLVRLAEIVEPPRTLAVIAADPADDRVLEAAAKREVDAIVSGDRHLLELGEWRGISIQSPAEFLVQLDVRDR